MTTEPTYEGVRKELMLLRKGHGFHISKFTNAENLQNLPAVNAVLARANARAGGRTVLAENLVKCVIERHSFVHEAHREILRYTMKLREFPPDQQDEDLDHRRRWASEELPKLYPDAFNHLEYRTVEEHALSELASALLELQESPCITSLERVTGHLLTDMVTVQGPGEARALVESILEYQFCLFPELALTDEPFTVLRQSLQVIGGKPYKRRSKLFRKAFPREYLLTPKTLQTYFDHWFEFPGELDRYSLTDLSFAKGSFVFTSAEFHAPHRNLVARAMLDNGLRNSLVLVNDEMFHSDDLEWEVFREDLADKHRRG